jgi:hypothetical protein
MFRTAADCEYAAVEKKQARRAGVAAANVFQFIRNLFSLKNQLRSSIQKMDLAWEKSYMQITDFVQEESLVQRAAIFSVS